MLGPKGNPQARNFFEIVAYLQKKIRPALESALDLGLAARDPEALDLLFIKRLSRLLCLIILTAPKRACAPTEIFVSQAKHY